MCSYMLNTNRYMYMYTDGGSPSLVFVALVRKVMGG